MDPAVLKHLRHELHTPLNHIIGYSEMLLEDAVEGQISSLEPGLRTVHDNAQRLLVLINDVLGKARVDAGEVNVARLSEQAEYAFEQCRFRDMPPVHYRILALSPPPEARLEALDGLVESIYLERMFEEVLEFAASESVSVSFTGEQPGLPL